MPEDEPDRIQDPVCRIWMDRSLCWVLSQASSSQSKLSRGTNNVFEQPCIMFMLVLASNSLHRFWPAGGLEDSDWWLAIYVMLTRGRKLENLILLGFTDQGEELLRRVLLRICDNLLTNWKPKLLWPLNASGRRLPMMDSKSTLVAACPASSADHLQTIWHIFWHSIWPLRSSGAHWAGKVPGWDSAVRTELGRSDLRPVASGPSERIRQSSDQRHSGIPPPPLFSRFELWMSISPPNARLSILFE